jgi:predicted nucleotidyltransferase
MSSIAQELKMSLPGILSRYPVVSAYLFGTLAQEQATPLSDVDIALVISLDEFSSSSRLKLELEIEDQINRFAEIPNVDVRIINDAPLMVQGKILTKGVLLYCQDEEARIEFETCTRMEYFDFLPAATRIVRNHLYLHNFLGDFDRFVHYILDYLNS